MKIDWNALAIGSGIANVATLGAATPLMLIAIAGQAINDKKEEKMWELRQEQIKKRVNEEIRMGFH